MIIQDKDKVQIQNRLADMAGKVHLVYFTQELECQFCHETGQLLRQVNAMSDKLSLDIHNFQLDKEKTNQYKIDKIPATVVVAEKDYGIRFFGVPAGYEFATLLEDIIAVSRGDSGLNDSTREQLKAVTKPVHIQVLVTPTCPYCPVAVRSAHAFAIENDNITADMVEITEFPHLAHKYNVRGVPKTVINEDIFIEGAVPENSLLEKVLEAATE